MASIAIPPVNGLRFIISQASGTIMESAVLSEEEVTPYIDQSRNNYNNGCFLQPIDLNQNSTVQVCWSQDIGNAPNLIVSINGVDQAPINGTVVGTLAGTVDNDFYAFDIDWTNYVLSDGDDVVVNLVIEGDTLVQAYTEPIIARDSDSVQKIIYDNNVNAYGVFYVNDEGGNVYKNVLYIEATFHEAQREQEKEGYRKSNGEFVSLSATLKKVVNFQSDKLLPDYVHEKIVLAISSDTLQINEDFYYTDSQWSKSELTRSSPNCAERIGQVDLTFRDYYYDSNRTFFNHQGQDPCQNFLDYTEITNSQIEFAVCQLIDDLKSSDVEGTGSLWNKAFAIYPVAGDGINKPRKEQYAASLKDPGASTDIIYENEGKQYPIVFDNDGLNFTSPDTVVANHEFVRIPVDNLDLYNVTGDGSGQTIGAYNSLDTSVPPSGFSIQGGTGYLLSSGAANGSKMRYTRLNGGVGVKFGDFESFSTFQFTSSPPPVGPISSGVGFTNVRRDGNTYGMYNSSTLIKEYTFAPIEPASDSFLTGGTGAGAAIGAAALATIGFYYFSGHYLTDNEINALVSIIESYFANHLDPNTNDPRVTYKLNT